MLPVDAGVVNVAVLMAGAGFFDFGGGGRIVADGYGNAVFAENPCRHSRRNANGADRKPFVIGGVESFGNFGINFAIGAFQRKVA